MSEKILILHNIRSVLNAGAIFRTADAVGIDKIYLSGYSPAPIDRFGRSRTDFKKAALGAEKTVVWEQIKNLSTLLKKLKKQHFKIIALEQSDNSTDYKKIKNTKTDKIAIIVGNETLGLEQKILNQVDVIAEIPMKGQKESLNVSVATGIFLYRIFDK